MPEAAGQQRERAPLPARRDPRNDDPAVRKLRDVVGSATGAASYTEAWADSIRGAVKILPANLVSRPRPSCSVTNHARRVPRPIGSCVVVAQDPEVRRELFSLGGRILQIIERQPQGISLTARARIAQARQMNETIRSNRIPDFAAGVLRASRDIAGAAFHG